VTAASAGHARSMPALGFDPAPGDVASLNALARRYGEVAAEVASVQSQVARIDLSRWAGKTAVAARAKRDILSQTLGQAADAAAKLGDAAARWAPRLADYQAEADTLERQAADAQANHTYLATRAPKVPQLNADLTESASALTAVRTKAEQLHQEYLTTAASIMNAFDLKAWWEGTEQYRTILEAFLAPLDMVTADRWISILNEIAKHPAKLLEPVDQNLAEVARLMADGAPPQETASALAKTAAAIERAGAERDAMTAFEPSSVQLAERAAPGIEWAGRGLGVLGIVADAGTLITPQDSGAVGWVDRGAAAVNGGFLTADLLGADAVMDVIPGVGEVAIAATGIYLAGDFFYHHWTPFHDAVNASGHAIATAADATGHAVAEAADATGHAAIKAADDVGHAASSAWDSTVGSLF
jgi:hypothetical protein